MLAREDFYEKCQFLHIFFEYLHIALQKKQ